ncbi:MAG: MerR family transcriptional regulator [Nocardioides sp.]|uniref:MerR family transcriptional regulator n=1 Tax=Nocardioides sp. TaxID=35761 RepID=UPI0039E52FBC
MAAAALTIDELSAATGVSVRTTRYYASLGLIPPPTRRGRVAYYGPEHRARLELVRALQEHGFTLQAIERQLRALPGGVGVDDLDMLRIMITAWTAAPGDDIQARIGRELLELGLPRDTMAASYEATSRHMAGLAAELGEILRVKVVEEFVRRPRDPAEMARLAEVLPRLRQLTIEAVVVSFQDAVNRVIAEALQAHEPPLPKMDQS